MNYVIGDAVPGKGVCRVGFIQNVPEWARMQKGTSQRGKFPADAHFKMHEDFRKDIKLADALSNTNNLLLVSERFVELLASLGALEQNDVHEVAILNHKGRREKARYFIVHQYDFINCVDEQKTMGQKSAVNPDEYIVVTRLVLDESKISPALGVFRPLQYNERPFFRRDVAAAIQKVGLTGIEFLEIEGYDFL